MFRKSIVLLAFLCGCGSDSAPFTPEIRLIVVTDKLSYEPGDEICITYENVGNVPLEVWACPAQFEFREGDTWRSPLGFMGCTAIPPQATPLRLREGSEFVMMYQEGGLPPGEWRVGFRLKEPGEEVFYSNGFQLLPESP